MRFFDIVPPDLELFIGHDKALGVTHAGKTFWITEKITLSPNDPVLREITNMFGLGEEDLKEAIEDFIEDQEN